ncbi:kinesin-like protein KIN-7G isoform X1 [Cicer arietinum]|uniref:Kinesin-like protein n=3 Tax=Cicer arietinum TaxID=3827 RepID=A0A1S2YSS9_CICAR|nr:kinesin-like protein KIN-7F isoform X1 [Cicer arietinum]XP_004509340.1 kinesin-like protein KIN-7F isoform X1 [Cicer arietinum]
MDSNSGEEAMQGSTGSEERIVVSVRVRPLNDKELAKNDLSEWECIDDTTIMYRSNLSASERSLYPTTYTFDRVFRADCPTRQVYEAAAKEVALCVLDGINSSIFAYGQTSSGKTYTMSGITGYAVADIFNYIEKVYETKHVVASPCHSENLVLIRYFLQHKEREFVLKFSAMEIYNESVRDLLSTDSTPLRLLDDPEKGTVVEKLTEETMRDWNHFIELISFCETQRQIGETSLNEASSRSHQILRLTIESSAREFFGNDKLSSLAASVNFIDLAGSERASQTNSAGARLKEGCHINRSLLTLGTVIRKLSKGRNGHIPFRDSKLTRILQSSIGGNARTAIICTMSPARSYVEQTRNTLLFACCAKEVATNAKVNVVMSDKLLVKQLQRELARLEGELRNSGSTLRKSDSAALLREKDLQIEMLKKEIMDLAFQRDLAHSQIKDMLQVGGDDMFSSDFESLDPQYPKLRVRSSMDFENQTTEPNLLAFDGLESVRSFDASQYSDGLSVSSEENYFQLPDLEKSLPIRKSFQGLSVVSYNDVTSDSDKNIVQEQLDDKVCESCKEVRCIEPEDPITNTHTHSNSIDMSPNKDMNSNASSPGANTIVSGLTKVDNIDKENKDLSSFELKENKELNRLDQGFFLLSSEKISPLLVEKNASRSRTLKLTRSRSCKPSLMKDSSSDWFDHDEIIQNTLPIGSQKDYIGRLEDFQKKTYILKYNPNAERLSWAGYGICERCSTADIQNVKSSFELEIGDDSDLSPVRKEKKELGRSNLLENNEVPDTGVKSTVSAKKFKNVGFNTLQSGEEKHLDWSSEFKQLQKEIIELWHSCNVSLVHRTYFFLLFKGDPSDSIYMEVELRRLSYLKENQILEDGRTLTPESSKRYLRRERQMLSKQMQRKLSKSDRENMYLKWGIRMSSKHRRLQLAHHLWSETEDINHIRESATIVAKLVGSVEPDQAFKEMFGLNFAPRRRRKKSFGWTSSMKHIL